MPRGFLVGRCIEIWSGDGSETSDWSAHRRFTRASAAWLDARGFPRGGREKMIGLPGALRGAGFVRWREVSGKDFVRNVADRLAVVGATVEDLPDSATG